MSNHNDKYHDETHAALFHAWFDTLPPRVQDRLSVWLEVLGIGFQKHKYTAEHALSMAESTLWALYEKNPPLLLWALERPLPQQIFSEGE